MDWHNNIKKDIDFLCAKLNGNLNVKDSIIISGSPRAGTTWLMEILSNLPKYKTIFEPLHPTRFPQLNKLGFPPRIFIPVEKENKFLQDIL